MNKVLLTGTIIGNELDLCQACNVNFDWLFDNPTTLLWAEKIIITKSAYEHLTKESDNKTELGIGCILELLNKANILEIVNIDRSIKDKIVDIQEKKIQKLMPRLQCFPTTNISKYNDSIVEEYAIDNEGYCLPYIQSVLSEVELAKSFNATCLFNDKEYKLLTNLYQKRQKDSIGNVYNFFFPNISFKDNYAFTIEEKCETCLNYNKCKESFIEDIEKNIGDIIKLRNQSDMKRVRKEISSFINKKGKIGEINSNDIIKELIKKQNEINNTINNIFPRIKKWIKISFFIATPINLIVGRGKDNAFSYGSDGVLTIATMAEAAMDIYEANNRWIRIINDNKNSLNTKE